VLFPVFIIYKCIKQESISGIMFGRF